MRPCSRTCVGKWPLLTTGCSRSPVKAAHMRMSGTSPASFLVKNGRDLDWSCVLDFSVTCFPCQELVDRHLCASLYCAVRGEAVHCSAVIYGNHAMLCSPCFLVRISGLHRAHQLPPPSSSFQRGETTKRFKMQLCNVQCHSGAGRHTGAQDVWCATLALLLALRAKPHTECMKAHPTRISNGAMSDQPNGRAGHTSA